MGLKYVNTHWVVICICARVFLPAGLSVVSSILRFTALLTRTEPSY